MLLAEGAVDLAAEPELELYDMAALDVIVREAGGRSPPSTARPGPLGGNALASNGRLHDQALAFLGSLADDGDDPDVAPRRHGLGARPQRASPPAPEQQPQPSDQDPRAHPDAERRSSGGASSSPARSNQP